MQYLDTINRRLFVRSLLISFSSLLVSGFAFAAGPGAAAVGTVGTTSVKVARNSMMAESPFSDFTAGAVIIVLIAGILIAALMFGAFLVVNLGLMSKRPEDHIGRRTPSDVGVLKHSIWPLVPYEAHVLPAEEEDFASSPPAAINGATKPVEPAPKKAA